jgi:citrate synthase
MQPTCSDGDKGELRYRGMPIEELFHHHDFDATMYLLIWGSIPTPDQKSQFESRVAEAAVPLPHVVKVIENVP